MINRPVLPFLTRITLLFLVTVALGYYQELALDWVVFVIPFGWALSPRLGFYICVVMSGWMTGEWHRPQVWDLSFDDPHIEIQNAGSGVRHSAVVYSVLADGNRKPVEIPVMLFLRDSIPAGRSMIQSRRFSIQYSEKYSTPAMFIHDYQLMHTDTSHIQRFRMAMHQRLSTLLDPSLHGIGFAMLLGSKEHLTAEEYTRYKEGGGAHVLAVSGLHVGLIYGFLLFLLKPLGNRPAMRTLRIGMMIIVLWLYAGVTGFSPSVVRAVGFFSVFVFFRSSASGVGHALVFLLLVVGIFRADILFTPGLQLSYAAVLGILLFQPFIERKISGLPFAWKWLTRMLGVSFTAQILTFPLVIHYFGGTSSLGIITSLVYIPFTFFTVVLLLLLMATGEIFAGTINSVLTEVKAISDGSIESLIGWEYAFVELSMSTGEMYIYYVGVISVYAAVRWPNKYLWLFILLGFGILMVGY